MKSQLLPPAAQSLALNSSTIAASGITLNEEQDQPASLANALFCRS
jgi:hypothetical protein